MSYCSYCILDKNLINKKNVNSFYEYLCFRRVLVFFMNILDFQFTERFFQFKVKQFGCNSSITKEFLKFRACLLKSLQNARKTNKNK